MTNAYAYNLSTEKKQFKLKHIEINEVDSERIFFNFLAECLATTVVSDQWLSVRRRSSLGSVLDTRACCEVDH